MGLDTADLELRSGCSIVPLADGRVPVRGERC